MFIRFLFFKLQNFSNIYFLFRISIFTMYRGNDSSQKYRPKFYHVVCCELECSDRRLHYDLLQSEMPRTRTSEVPVYFLKKSLYILWCRKITLNSFLVKNWHINWSAVAWIEASKTSRNNFCKTNRAGYMIYFLTY